MGILLSDTTNEIQIKIELAKRGWKQRDLASALRISEGRLSKIIRGVETNQRLRNAIQKELDIMIYAWQPKEEDDASKETSHE